MFTAWAKWTPTYPRLIISQPIYSHGGKTAPAHGKNTIYKVKKNNFIIHEFTKRNIVI